MRAWIRVLEAPGCYEHAARAERKSALQGSGLVRTVGSCAQRRVALMPWAIATARRILSIERSARKRHTFREAGLLSTGAGASHRASSEARGKVCSLSYIPVSSPVTTIKQSENVAIAHLVGGVWPLIFRFSDLI